MKLLTKTDIAQNKASEIDRDVGRLELVREALKRAQSDLDEVNAKGEVALANQRIRFAKEEEEYTLKITNLTKELKELEERRQKLLIPIDSEKEKAHNLFKAAEDSLADAKKARREADDIRKKNEEEAEYLQNRIDELTEREANVADREQKVQIGEANLQLEKEQLKQLSKDLLAKLKQ